MILAKRLTEKEKIGLVKSFTEGKTVDQLTKEFDYTKSTIIRNLKKDLGEEKYKLIIIHNKKIEKSISVKKEDFIDAKNNLEKKQYSEHSTLNDFYNDDLSPLNSFTEITPLYYEIENTQQKDLSSIPISDIDFPKSVYMVVNKNIELEIKYLNEYPNWQFLSKEELNRKTIEIYFDLKIAKRFCDKEQKVIKVPNTDVFKIVAPLLKNRGISRIVSAEKLISL